MRFWLTSFFILFALVKLVEWLRSLEVPFSMVVIAGVLLAIASNYDKRQLFPFWSDAMAARAMAADAATSADVNGVSSRTVEAASSSTPMATPAPTSGAVPTSGTVERLPFNN